MATAVSIPSSEQWAKRVCEELGIDPVLCARLIIDCKPSEPIRVYVEMIGSDQFLQFDAPLMADVEVKILERA